MQDDCSPVMNLIRSYDRKVGDFIEVSQVIDDLKKLYIDMSNKSLESKTPKEQNNKG